MSDLPHCTNCDRLREDETHAVQAFLEMEKRAKQAEAEATNLQDALALASTGKVKAEAERDRLREGKDAWEKRWTSKCHEFNVLREGYEHLTERAEQAEERLAEALMDKEIVKQYAMRYEAERDKLREALERIAEWDEWESAQIARAALDARTSPQ